MPWWIADADGRAPLRKELEAMQEKQLATATTLALIHQNQVALGEAVQLIASWFLRHGVSEVTSSLQVHMELLVSNSTLINSRLD